MTCRKFDRLFVHNSSDCQYDKRYKGWRTKRCSDDMEARYKDTSWEGSFKFNRKWTFSPGLGGTQGLDTDDELSLSGDSALSVGSETS